MRTNTVRNTRGKALATTTALALGLSLTGGHVASATPDPAPQSASSDATFSETERAEAAAGLADLGIDRETQESLLTKLENGERWDSFTPGAEPVDTVTEVSGDTEIRTDTYADGSVAVHENSVPQEAGQGAPEDGTMGISECSVSSSPYHVNYKNCKANVNLGVISMGFYYDREAVRGGYDKITRAWGHHHHCVGCSLSGHRIEEFSPQDYRYSTDLDVAFKGFPVGWTAYMGVRIQNGIASTYNN